MLVVVVFSGLAFVPMGYTDQPATCKKGYSLLTPLNLNNCLSKGEKRQREREGCLLLVLFSNEEKINQIDFDFFSLSLPLFFVSDHFGFLDR